MNNKDKMLLMLGAFAPMMYGTNGFGELVRSIGAQPKQHPEKLCVNCKENHTTGKTYCSPDCCKEHRENQRGASN